MSLSATISLSANSVSINQVFDATLIISNSGSSAVNITNVTPIGYLTGDASPGDAAVALGVVDLGPGAVIQVGASGTLAKTFSTCFFAPSGDTTYSVGANITASDGTTFSPTPATITVNPIVTSG